jgi:uncharacterized lipoprotein
MESRYAIIKQAVAHNSYNKLSIKIESFVQTGLVFVPNYKHKQTFLVV